MVQSEHVRTFFDSTQSQESKSEVCAKEFCAAMHIKTPLDNALYLSSLWSDLSMLGHFLIVLNLGNPNLRTKITRQRALRHISTMLSILAPCQISACEEDDLKQYLRHSPTAS